MKILYFSRGYTPHDHRFLKLLAETDHEVAFLHLERGSVQLEKRPVPDGIREVDWIGAGEGRPMADRIAAFANVVAEIEPDAIQAGPVQTCGSLVAAIGFHPFVVMSLASDVLVDSRRSERDAAMARQVLKAADYLLCDCRAVARRVKELLPFPDERIVCFPWGVDTVEFAPSGDSRAAVALRQSLGWEESTVVLSNRTWASIYGVDIVLKAFEAAREGVPRLRLLLAGDGPLAKEIESVITTRGLTEVVHTPGRIPNDRLRDYYAMADVYLSCSRSDGSSVSLLEALACGLPVVAGNVGGIPEWVHPSENGYLVSVDDVGGFAAALTLVASADRSERARLAAAARTTAVTRADWRRNSQQLLDLFDHIDRGR